MFNVLGGAALAMTAAAGLLSTAAAATPVDVMHPVMTGLETPWRQASDGSGYREDRYRSDRYGRNNYDSGYDRQGYRYDRNGVRYDRDGNRYEPRYRNGRRYYDERVSENTRTWRGRDGRYYCKKTDGTTGLVIGGVAGGVVGNVIDGGHNRVLGTVLGAAGGALLGREIERGNDKGRCR